MKNKILLFRIIATIVFAVLVFYITIPALNIHNFGFYTYLIFIILFYLFTGIYKTFDISNIINLTKRQKKRTINSYLILSIPICFILIILINIGFSPLFNSKSYANRIVIDESGSFKSDVDEVDLKALPLLDKDSSSKLGDRVMGQLSELVSQFYVSNLYTQINYNNDIVRVTPLEYADIIKYFTNRKNGVKGYITVNSVTGEANLTKLDKGMKYMPSAMFNENLSRYLRFKYPTLIFDSPSFEIDEEGKPYWIVPIVSYKAVGLKKDISGIIILNPITGDSKKYSINDVPTWVDHVYSADLIIEQVNDWGAYKGGFFNSLFGQKGVVMSTDGYNYTVMNDDVYLYTGITSVSTDESNLGFILCNMRTKETKFYKVAGAEEYSAMSSAEGQVQQMGYVASFPLLINLKGKPTYLISLKDNAGLVKIYALVDVVDYQKVVVTDSSLGIEKAFANFINNQDITYNEDEINTKNITIKTINMALIEGNSIYYIIDNENNHYKLNINVNSNIIPFLSMGDTIGITYINNGDIIEIIAINRN